MFKNTTSFDFILIIEYFLDKRFKKTFIGFQRWNI